METALLGPRSDYLSLRAHPKWPWSSCCWFRTSLLSNCCRMQSGRLPSLHLTPCRYNRVRPVDLSSSQTRRKREALRGLRLGRPISGDECTSR